VFVFDTNGRVQKVTEGIQFYEQDILCSSYSFTGDQRVELNIDYVMPGFGIAIIEENLIGPATQDSNAYLFKVGVNTFTVFEKLLGKQNQTLSESCLFEPEAKNAHLTFELIKKKVRLIYHTFNNQNEPVERMLGEYKIKTAFERYRIGFYSNAGNVIKSLGFYGRLPAHWRVSTINTIGGRISFEKNTLSIENCEYAAEVEQECIKLKAGTYWLKYDTEPVNEQFDIKPYIFLSHPDSDNESELEDDVKNILQDGNKLHIASDKVVTLKFKGHNGRVSNLCLVDDEFSEFVETEDTPYYQKGSEIVLRLDGLKRAEWTAVVKGYPEWLDLTKPCPYAIIATHTERKNMESLNLYKDKTYNYLLEVDDMKLTITDETDTEVYSGNIKLTPADANSIVIMKNVTMLMTKFILTNQDGSTFNVIVQKTFKHYIPGHIEGPIIVTPKNSSNVFDISAAYREVVIPQTKIRLFTKDQPFHIDEELPVNAHSVKLYGIPKGAKINQSADNIAKFATAYMPIPEEVYNFTGSFFTVLESVRKDYPYFALEYDSIDDYDYEFTNFEREIFDGNLSVINLAKNIDKGNSEVVIYGIPQDAKVRDDCLYRIPDIGMINSIDYYADVYEQLPAASYSVNFLMNQIRFKKALLGKYKTYIVDYLKADSCAINYRTDLRQYEIDVATDAKEIRIHYDSHEDGGIYQYLYTDIAPNINKYVVLRREEDDDEN